MRWIVGTTMPYSSTMENQQNAGRELCRYSAKQERLLTSITAYPGMTGYSILPGSNAVLFEPARATRPKLLVSSH